MSYKFKLNPNSILLDAVKFLEASRKTIVPIVDEHNILVGVISDGDIRRALLKGASLQSNLTKYMNQAPLRYIQDQESFSPYEIMKSNNIEALPIVNAKLEFLDVISIHDKDLKETVIDLDTTKNVVAFILAGGEGLRLRPITEKVPKPMVEFAGKPLLEHQIKKLVSEGIKNIEISINYLGHIIEEYFSDGKNFGVNISYIREQEKKGTAGSIAYSPSKNGKTLVVINGDVVSKVSYQNILKHHAENKADLTVACTAYSIHIPYGVVKTEGAKIVSLEEKPTQSLLCSAGIYVLGTKASALIPEKEFYNMTDLIKTCISKNLNVSAYPMHEYWSDIGTFEELENARQRWKNDDVFKK